ncbi:hypothetical protein DH2020_049142 [Rehmannia glutinosa]|uniref:Generative cell specific-1/HAP2 domain-containing protein n=1 Tax=Rehmannia glutinosa TaxID=99300 RepID=A0ABR0U3M3_REHGL
MRTLRIPPVITINKSAAYALYELTYIRDVAYKPQEFYVRTRKCQPDAAADVVKICCEMRMVTSSSILSQHAVLVETSAGYHHRVETFRSVGFSIRIEVKTKSKTSEVIVGPENRTAISNDKFLRVNMVGDYVGYTDIPSFDDFYLVIPRQGGPGQPQNLGSNFSMWMLLERVRFTLDGLECNKIGVGYEAFNAQPDFCAAPFWSCLHNQLWNFWDADQNRVSRNQNAGSHAFSIGITEVLNTNLLIELRADDIDYIYQRSPGKILGITVPTFEALTQFGTATITTKNVGEVEASYSLTFDCSSGVSQMEEQFYIMKPKEVITRSFKLYPTTDQAARYACTAILKDSDFSEVDRAECQFTTTATVLENGSQIPFQPPKTSVNGFFESIEELWNKFWTSFADFVTGRSCRRKCSGFFDFSCHIQYISIVLLWLLHQKGLFDPIYDWWEDHIWTSEGQNRDIWKHGRDADLSLIHLKKKHRHDKRHHKHDTHRRRSHHSEHRHNNRIGEDDYRYYLHHVHKDKHKHGRLKNSGISEQVHLSTGDYDRARHHRRRKERHLAVLRQLEDINAPCTEAG